MAYIILWVSAWSQFGAVNFDETAAFKAWEFGETSTWTFGGWSWTKTYQGNINGLHETVFVASRTVYRGIKDRCATMHLTLLKMELNLSELQN